MNFSELNLEILNEVKIIQIGDKEIEIKQYLSLEEKNDIIALAIQESIGGTVLNTLVFDAILHLLIVLKYSNIELTEKEKENLFKIYDILEQNGIINLIISNIPNEEYNYIFSNAKEIAEEYKAYINSAGVMFNHLGDLISSISTEIKKVAENSELIDNIVNIAKIQNQKLTSN